MTDWKNAEGTMKTKFQILNSLKPEGLRKASKPSVKVVYIHLLAEVRSGHWQSTSQERC